MDEQEFHYISLIINHQRTERLHINLSLLINQIHF